VRPTGGTVRVRLLLYKRAMAGQILRIGTL